MNRRWIVSYLVMITGLALAALATGWYLFYAIVIIGLSIGFFIQARRYPEVSR